VSQHERSVCVCRFHTLLCRLSGASARVVWAAFSRCVCNCAPVFPEGVAVPPEELNKFFRPLLPCVVLRAVASAPVEDLLF
jgi:hypothetical protein